MAQVRPVNKSWCLEQLCADNYRRLLSLVPDLAKLDRSTFGSAIGKPDLQLTLIEKSRYTVTIQLSHSFAPPCATPLAEPAVKIRVYLDAQLAEVLRDHERPYPNQALGYQANSREIMDYKWEMNYFLEKWLNHCLQVRYRFNNQGGKAPQAVTG